MISHGACVGFILLAYAIGIAVGVLWGRRTTV
jgi:hypothetical protein